MAMRWLGKSVPGVIGTRTLTHDAPGRETALGKVQGAVGLPRGRRRQVNINDSMRLSTDGSHMNGPTELFSRKGAVDQRLISEAGRV